MVADSSSHDSATTENDGDGEILGETQESERDFVVSRRDLGLSSQHSIFATFR